MSLKTISCPRCQSRIHVHEHGNKTFECQSCHHPISLDENSNPIRLSQTNYSTTNPRNENAVSNNLNTPSGGYSKPKPVDESTSPIAYVLLFLGALGALGTIYSIASPYFNKSDKDIKKSQYEVSHSTPSNSTSASNNNLNEKIVVYSGICVRYKRSLTADKKLTSTLIDTAFGKLIIGLNKKSFNFYYNGKQVFARNQYDSYIDQAEGGEGFTSYNGADAHKLTAERYFEINYRDIYNDKSDLGYQYQMINYKEN